MGLRPLTGAVRLARFAALLVGCASIPRPAAAGEPAAGPTYHRDVRPILQARCVNCHRKDQVGPFALETYEQAKKRSHDLADVAEDRSMPPWKADGKFGPALKHDPSLTDAQIEIGRAHV